MAAELHKWEEVGDATRMAVPGGWIYWFTECDDDGNAVAALFVPEPPAEQPSPPVNEDSWAPMEEFVQVHYLTISRLTGVPMPTGSVVSVKALECFKAALALLEDAQ